MLEKIHEYLKQDFALHQLMVLLVLLNVLDFLTTQILVGYGGFEVEVNPLLRYAMVKADSSWALLPAKAILIAFALFWFKKAETTGTLITKQRVPYIVAALCAGFVLLICWNTSLIYLWNTL